MTKPSSAAIDETEEPAEALGWQAQKSASTRTQIIEAAIKCFIECGYSRTTTTLIAEKAGLSRGAMLHHFRWMPRLRAREQRRHRILPLPAPAPCAPAPPLRA